MLRWGLLIGILVALAAPAPSSAAGCSGLSGKFAVVPGSAGAGNIVYRLSMHNGGSASCVLQGLPKLRLYALDGTPLPTHVALEPSYVAKPFVLRPGKTASAMARFSPDVPGPGEPAVKGHCEPVAWTALVSAGGTTLVLPLRRPTSVCEHGRLTFRPYR